MEEIATARLGRMLTHADHAGLSRLLHEAAPVMPQKRAMQDALATWMRLPPSLVPATLVTINARVLLQNHGSDVPYETALCYPAQADATRARVSVLSPLGASLLGLSVGDTVAWQAFGRVHKAKIVAILSYGEYAWRAGRRPCTARAQRGTDEEVSP